MKNIKDYNLDELQEELINMGEKKFRAEQIFKWIYKEKVKGDQNGKFNRFYVLRIWCIPFDLPCWCIHLSDLSVDQEMARKQRRERRLKEGSQNGRYYHYINCNHLAWVGSERINQTF